MRLLFVKENLAWPRSSGHDVHTYYMMRELGLLGHQLGLLTLHEPSGAAIQGLPLEFCQNMNTYRADTSTIRPRIFSRLQERYRNYWGIDETAINSVAIAAQEFGTDAVIVVGLNVLPYLRDVSGCMRIWYAADEWCWHHLSQFRLNDSSSWSNIKQGLVKALYERAFASLLDRVWVVSKADAIAMKVATGLEDIDLVCNGVDTEYYRPGQALDCPQSCVFWGRLDFGPNVQALSWFCERVWPLLLASHNEARFTIYGFNPSDAVLRLAKGKGVSIVPDLPDLREGIAEHQTVVLPFISGGGVKNKLLEACSMGKAIVCSPHACGGLQGDGVLPFVVAHKPEQWVRLIQELWSDAAARSALGKGAREWVRRHHTWESSAQMALRGLRDRSCGVSTASTTVAAELV